MRGKVKYEKQCEVSEVKGEVGEVSVQQVKQEEKSLIHSCDFEPKQAYRMIKIYAITAQQHTAANKRKASLA